MPLRAQSGFNMIELVIVMALVGILSAYALPQMTAATGMQDAAWHDSVQSALRFAQKGAVARRRLTCVAFTSTTITISTATVNPATSCDTTMTGPDGSMVFATASNNSAATTVSTGSVIYFQPDGRATDATGVTAISSTISMANASNIVVYGDTGYVE